MFEKLPKETLFHLLSFLPSTDLFHLQYVSRFFRAFINDDALWTTRYDPLLEKADDRLLEKTVFPDIKRIDDSCDVNDMLRESLANRKGRDGKHYHFLYLQVMRNDSLVHKGNDYYTFWRQKIEAKLSENFKTVKEKCQDLIISKKRIQAEDKQHKRLLEEEEERSAKRQCFGN